MLMGPVKCPQESRRSIRSKCHHIPTRRTPELAPATILNIAAGVPRRIGDMLGELLDLAGLHTEIATDTARLRGPEIQSAIGDAGRARQLLGWTPTIPWQQTLADVLADWSARVAG